MWKGSYISATKVLQDGYRDVIGDMKWNVEWLLQMCYMVVTYGFVFFLFEDCYIYVTGVTGNKKSVTGVSQEYYLREMDTCGL